MITTRELTARLNAKALAEEDPFTAIGDAADALVRRIREAKMEAARRVGCCAGPFVDQPPSRLNPNELDDETRDHYRAKWRQDR